MRIQFSFLLDGQESIEEKIIERMKIHTEIHTEMLRAHCQIIMLAFGLNKEDNASFSNYNVVKLIEEEKVEQEKVEVEKPEPEIELLENT